MSTKKKRVKAARGYRVVYPHNLPDGTKDGNLGKVIRTLTFDQPDVPALIEQLARDMIRDAVGPEHIEAEITSLAKPWLRNIEYALAKAGVRARRAKR